MAKSLKKREAGEGVAPRPARSRQPTNVTEREIERRAYDLYLARGREHGHDLEDWLQAERELTEPPHVA